MRVFEGADALVLCTEWEVFRSSDWERVKALMRSPVVFDGRNIFDPSKRGRWDSSTTGWATVSVKGNAQPTALVAGEVGFIGSHLCKHLLDHPAFTFLERNVSELVNLDVYTRVGCVLHLASPKGY